MARTSHRTTSAAPTGMPPARPASSTPRNFPTSGRHRKGISASKATIPVRWNCATSEFANCNRNGLAQYRRRHLLPRLAGEPIEVVDHRAIAQRQFTAEFLCAVEASAALIEEAEPALLEAQHRDVGRRPHRQVPQLFELDLLRRV